MLLLSVEPEKWYRISELEKILGWSHDRIEDWIDEGVIQAFVIELRSDKRKRTFRGKRVQGCEVIRFVKEHLTELRPNARPRFRIA